MAKKLKTILLLDDNKATNFIHKKFIAEADCAERILDFQSGINALQYLNSKTAEAPELIIVDINMPIMSAWDFLDEYKQVVKNKPNQRSKLVILSTSLSPSDKARIKQIDLIDGVQLKPLDVAAIQKMMEDFFPNLPVNASPETTA